MTIFMVIVELFLSSLGSHILPRTRGFDLLFIMVYTESQSGSATGESACFAYDWSIFDLGDHMML